jgi:hypothetical protein
MTSKMSYKEAGIGVRNYYLPSKRLLLIILTSRVRIEFTYDVRMKAYDFVGLVFVRDDMKVLHNGREIMFLGMRRGITDKEV